MEGEKRRTSNGVSSSSGKTENGSSIFRQEGNRQDPYVIRATQTAKNKLRDRILGLSGGRPN